MGTKSKVKARRMWANYYTSGVVLHLSKMSAVKGSEHAALPEALPVAVIPLDDVEALLQKACEAFYEIETSSITANNGECMLAALTAIGVLPKARAKKGRK